MPPMNELLEVVDAERVAMVWRWMVRCRQKQVAVEGLCQRIRAKPDFWHHMENARTAYGDWHGTITAQFWRPEGPAVQITYRSIGGLVRSVRFRDPAGRASRTWISRQSVGRDPLLVDVLPQGARNESAYVRRCFPATLAER